MRAAASVPLFLLFATCAARAATIHVPGEQPTIQAGLDAASPGDTVEVACGTYHEHDIVLKSGVVLQSDAPGCVTVDADLLGRVFEGSFLDSTTVLRGLIIRRGHAFGTDDFDTRGGGLFLFRSSPRIEHCVFEGNLAGSGGGLGAFISDPRLSSCIFRDNASGGIVLWGSFDIRTRAYKCLFQSGGDVSCRETNITFTRCTFSASGLVVGISAEVIADHTIFHQSSVICVVVNPGRGEVTCSLVGQLPECIEAIDNVSGDPLFCDPGNGDFHVAGTSPCIQTSGPCAGLIGAYGVGCDETFVDVLVTTSPPGFPVEVDGAFTMTPAEFVWAHFSEHAVAVEPIHVYDEGRRYEFQSWSDGGAQEHELLVSDPPFEFTATYEHQFELEVVVETAGGGTGGEVAPGSGWFPAGAQVELSAIPEPGFAFLAWEGSGEGSYSGPNNPAVVSMSDPLTQVARFVPVGYEFTISASATDPTENEGTPTGEIRSLFLWITCANGGLTFFEASVEGTLVPLSFVTAEGIINGGDASELQLVAIECISGEAPAFLLGSWFVIDDGGTMCLGPPANTPAPRVLGCALDSVGTLDPGVTGFSSDGNPPCRVGVRTCVPSPTGIGSEGISSSWEQSSLSLLSVAPNPFADATTFWLSLRSDGRTVVTIYDVAGRLIKRLVEGNYAPGAHRLSWDGRDARGRRVAGGTYFVRLQTGNDTHTKRVVFLGE